MVGLEKSKHWLCLNEGLFGIKYLPCVLIHTLGLVIGYELAFLDCKWIFGLRTAKPFSSDQVQRYENSTFHTNGGWKGEMQRRYFYAPYAIRVQTRWHRIAEAFRRAMSNASIANYQ